MKNQKGKEGSVKKSKFVLICFLFIIACVSGIIVTNFFTLQLYAKGTFIHATVTEHIAFDGGDLEGANYRYYAQYTYTIDGVYYENKEQTFGTYKDGDKILIRYQKNSPEKSCVAFGVNIQISLLFLGMIVVVTIVIVVRNRMGRRQGVDTSGTYKS